MQTIKRSLALILAVMVMITLIPSSVLAADIPEMTTAAIENAEAENTGSELKEGPSEQTSDTGMIMLRGSFLYVILSVKEGLIRCRLFQ